MPNSFLGFPVPRAKIADMIAAAAPPALHHAQHENGGSDEIDATGLTGAGGGGISLSSFFPISEPFSSIDGYSQTIQNGGSITLTSTSLNLRTSSTASGRASLYKDSGASKAWTSWDKDKVFSVDFSFIYTATVCDYIYIQHGKNGTNKHIGFKIIDSVLYGTVGNGSAETTVTLETFTTPSTQIVRILTAVFTAGVKCEFYVDGVLLGTITTNLPSGVDTSLRLFQAENKLIASLLETQLLLMFYSLLLEA